MKVFVVMPFAREFRDIYELGVKAACKSCKIDCERVDEQIFEETILARIYNQISEADLILAVMTGKNANVYYEVGYAHGLKKRVVPLIHDANEIPFDLRNYPHVVYGDSIVELKEKLEVVISHYAEHPEKLHAEIKTAAETEGSRKQVTVRDRVYEALGDPAYKWRFIETLATVSGSTEGEVVELLLKDPGVVFGKSKEDGRRIARLKNREIAGAA